MNSSQPVDVVVIGAGYAGVIATNRLLGSLTDAEAGRVRLTVVNPRPDFVERIRLHELAAEHGTASPSRSPTCCTNTPRCSSEPRA